MNRISALSVNRPLDDIGIAGHWYYPPALGRKSWPQRQKWFSDYMKALYRSDAAESCAPQSRSRSMTAQRG
jgi:hypothetical protein